MTQNLKNFTEEAFVKETKEQSSYNYTYWYNTIYRYHKPFELHYVRDQMFTFSQYAVIRRLLLLCC